MKIAQVTWDVNALLRKQFESSNLVPIFVRAGSLELDEYKTRQVYIFETPYLSNNARDVEQVQFSELIFCTMIRHETSNETITRTHCEILVPSYPVSLLVVFCRPAQNTSS